MKGIGVSVIIKGNGSLYWVDVLCGWVKANSPWSTPVSSFQRRPYVKPSVTFPDKNLTEGVEGPKG